MFGRSASRPGLTVLHVNASAAALLGWPADDPGACSRALGSLLAGVHPEDRHALQDAFDRERPVEARLAPRACAQAHRLALKLAPLPEGLWVAIVRDLKPIQDLEADLVGRALRDGLTGLLNRRAWAEQADTHFQASLRYGRPLALMMLDLDHFKQINDRFGHQTGDAVLKAVSGACRGAVRRVDVLGRVGGEELALLAPETGLAGASTLAVRICNAVRRIRVAGPSAPVGVTVSVGVVERSVTDTDFDGLLARADAAMYRAKAEGRDRVVVA